MRIADQERYALEARAEALAFVSADAAVRRGESDLFEVGRLASSDAVDGQEEQRTGGDHVESAHAHSLRAARVETQVDGKMSLQAHSDTTLLGGAMAETYVGPVLLLAGMSDALVAGGGMRVSVADLALAGLVGCEEKIGSACADGALVEAYATHFEREYGPGSHVAGFASFSGTVHITSASGFRPLFKVASGVRNLTAGGGGGAGPEGPAASPAQRPLPPPPPPARRPGASLAGGTPNIAGIYEDIGDFADIGGDAARVLDGAAGAEDLGDYAEVRDVARLAEEPEYDYIGVLRQIPDPADEPARGAQRSAQSPSLGEYVNIPGGSEASRGTDTANALDNLRSTANLQGYEDAQRGAILDLVNDFDSVALADDVDRSAVVAQLRNAEIDAAGDAVLAGFRGDTATEAAQNDIAQLYGLARSTVEAGNDPQPVLDRLSAIYRWRAENALEAYPNQADAVADVRASVDTVLLDNGYRRSTVGTDDALDADLAGRLEDLFNTADETAGTTDETALAAEDTSELLGNLFNEPDDGAASAISPETTPSRDPRDLTVGEIDAYRSDGESNWLDALSSNADAPSRSGDFRAEVPIWNQRLEQYDDGIVDLLKQQQRPPLGDEGDRAALLEDLRSAEAAAIDRVDRANAARNAVAADVALDRLAAIKLAADAVERGEDPLLGLNDLVDVYRWRNQGDIETYAGQARIFEDARDDIALLFRNNGFAASPELSNSDFLPQAQDLFRQVDDLRDSARGLEGGADGRATLAVEQADDLVDNVQPDLFATASAEDSAPYSRLNWQGRFADADSFADGSTDAAARALTTDDPDAAQYLYSRLNVDGGDSSRPRGVSMADNTLYQQSTIYVQNTLYGSSSDTADDLYESLDLYERLDIYETIDDYGVGGPLPQGGSPRGTEIAPAVDASSLPFVPQRLPEDIDADGFIDFVRAQRDDLVDPLTGRPPAGATPADARIRAQHEAYGLAFEALQKGDDPLALIDDRLRSARLRQAGGTPLIEDEVEILTRIRQTIAENFDTFRDGTGPLYDYIAVDEAQQVDQLRQAVSDSTAAGGQSRVAPGAAVDDFVRPTDGRSSGLSSDLTTQRPPAYEDIDALDNVARNAPADLEDAAEPVYSDLRTFPRQNRQALPSDPSRRAPPLRFNSDDPSRFGGILRGQGDLQGKPIFHLTDVEIELVSEGLLDVIVTDVDTLQELPSNAFGLTNRPIASTAGQADSGLSFNFSPRGRGVASGTPQPLPPISPTPTPPTAGGATTPLPRPS